LFSRAVAVWIGIPMIPTETMIRTVIAGVE
jgi:hypothetical protein